MYELSTNDSASFLTLTYNDEHLPLDYGLHKEDLQKFFKRLRINLKREYHEYAPKIKYYACGEYGDKTMRPHFHAVVYGLDNFDDKHREICAKSWQLCDEWFFDKNRGRDSAMQEVTPDDIQYVTGYIQKKLYGDKAKEKYGDRLPPFSVCSNGLGLDFCMDNKERLIANGWTYFKGHQMSLPRYFADKLGVNKSDYIKSNYNVNQLESSFDETLALFYADMQKMGVDIETLKNNTKMQEVRLKNWFAKREYEYTQQVYKDFQQRQKLRNRGL